MEWSTGFNRQLQRFLIRNVVVELHGDCGDPDSAFSLYSALEIPGKTVQNRRKIDFPIAFVSCSPGLDARFRGNIEKKRLNPRFPFFQRAGKLEYLIVPVSQPQRKPRKLGRFRQKAIKQRTRLKIQLTSYMDQVFPELQYYSNQACTKKLSIPF